MARFETVGVSSSTFYRYLRPDGTPRRTVETTAGTEPSRGGGGLGWRVCVRVAVRARIEASSELETGAQTYE